MQYNHYVKDAVLTPLKIYSLEEYINKQVSKIQYLQHLGDSVYNKKIKINDRLHYNFCDRLNLALKLFIDSIKRTRRKS